MSRPFALFAVLLCLACTARATAAEDVEPAEAQAGGAEADGAARTWKYEAGEWPLKEGPVVSQGDEGEELIENAELDRVDQLLARRRYGRAKNRALRWLKANPDAPDRDRGLYLLAEAYDHLGDPIRAFYHLDELMDYYPESGLFYPALEKQYEIGDEFIGGRQRRFLGMYILDAYEEGVEMLYRVQERSPGSPVAERALLRTANHYYDTSQFDLASDAYAAYARSFPRSPEVTSGRVPLRQAFASLAQFRGLRYDGTPLVDAQTQLEAIRIQYPDLAEEQNVDEVLERIKSTQAAKAFEAADFYRRTNEPRAAVYMWRYVIENYPDTAEADVARRELERMPEWALEEPADPAVAVAEGEGEDAAQGDPGTEGRDGAGEEIEEGEMGDPGEEEGPDAGGEPLDDPGAADEAP